MTAGNEAAAAAAPPNRRGRGLRLMGRRRPSQLSLPTAPQPSPSTPNTSAPLTPGRASPDTAEVAGLPPLRLPPARRQPVLLSRPARPRGATCAEVAGNTAADCAAVCCCCPCGIIDLLVLAVVKLPAGLCRQAYRKQRKKLKPSKKQKGLDAESGGGATGGVLLHPKAADDSDDDDLDEFIIISASGPVVVGPGLLVGAAVGWPADTSPSLEISEMDKQMWAHFYGTGFWRSPSQKDT